MKFRVLLVLENSTYFRPIFELAKFLQAQVNINVLVLMPIDYPNSLVHRQKLEEVQIPVVKLQLISEDLPLAKFISRIFNRSLFLRLAMRAYKLNKILTKLHFDRKFTHFILPADNLYCQPNIIKFARDNGISSAVMPYWFIPERDSKDVMSQNPLRYVRSSIGNRIINVLFPTWACDLKNSETKILPASWQEILIREICGLRPPNPWLLHSGYSDFILCESMAAAKAGIRYGLPPEKFKIIGSSALQSLFSLQDSRRRLASPASSLTCVIALPPDMFYSRTLAELEFQNFEDFIIVLLEPLLATKRVNILLSPHPSVENLQYLELPIGKFKLDRRPIEALIAEADFFVGCASSTIHWAIASLIPVINYDVYQYDWDVYRDVPSVLHGTSANSYRRNLQLLIENYEYYLELSSRQIDWGERHQKFEKLIIEFLENTYP
jgi:hypothetical protein